MAESGPAHAPSDAQPLAQSEPMAAPAIRGTRMRVADVLSLLAAGASEEEVLGDHPYLAADDIRTWLAYATALTDHAVVISS